MDEKKKKELLKGLGEYYSNRRDILNESDDSQIIEIDGLKVRKIKGTIADYAREHNLINIEDMQWEK
ncbi:MAG: hypothetical protein IKX59_08975 [Bacteroidales bacterium]|nr:hypothetical protein [Bacteroidales bacterium]